MIVELVGREELLDLNDTQVAVVINNIEDRAVITSNHAVKLRIIGRIGSRVIVRLGKNSELVLEPCVEIGANFTVEIPGDKASIKTNGVSIPQDAFFVPAPR